MARRQGELVRTSKRGHLARSLGSLLFLQQFCESVQRGEGTLHLCPDIAYCPNGPRDIEPLYLQKDGFGGVQWAPIANEQGNSWVMVGNFGGMTCQTYMQINNREPAWGLDGTSSQLKQNILCCESEESPSPIEQGSVSSSEPKEVEPTPADDVHSTFGPIWFDEQKGGWKGGSHDDAQVCQENTSIDDWRTSAHVLSLYSDFVSSSRARMER